MKSFFVTLIVIFCLSWTNNLLAIPANGWNSPDPCWPTETGIAEQPTNLHSWGMTFDECPDCIFYVDFWYKKDGNNFSVQIVGVYVADYYGSGAASDCIDCVEAAGLWDDGPLGATEAKLRMTQLFYMEIFRRLTQEGIFNHRQFRELTVAQKPCVRYYPAIGYLDLTTRYFSYEEPITSSPLPVGIIPAPSLPIGVTSSLHIGYAPAPPSNVVSIGGYWKVCDDQTTCCEVPVYANVDLETFELLSWSIPEVTGYEVPICEDGCQGDCGDLEWTWTKNDGFINVDNGKLTTSVYLSDLQITPNPNTGKFEVSFGNEIMGAGEFEIFDEVGNLIKSIPFSKETVKHVENISINVSNGTYIVRIEMNDTVVATKKIIINK